MDHLFSLHALSCRHLSRYALSRVGVEQMDPAHSDLG